MKNILRVIFILVFSFNMGFSKNSGEEVSTKNDIRVLIELIKSNQEATNQRFDDVNRRFDDVNKRFDDVNNRFNDMNRRFEFIQNLVYLVITSIFSLVGFIIWDRKKMLDSAKVEFSTIVDEKLIAKADKKDLDKFFEIIEHLAKKMKL